MSKMQLDHNIITYLVITLSAPACLSRFGSAIVLLPSVFVCITWEIAGSSIPFLS